MELQVLYSPIFKNQNSTQRADRLKKELPDFAKRYLQQDANIALKVRELVIPLKKRVQELKEKKPPIPPFRDKTFNDLYARYSKLIEERQTVFETFRNEYSEDKKSLKETSQKLNVSKRARSVKTKVFFRFKTK